MLTKAQQSHMDDVIARVGKPSPALRFKINQLRAAKTEGEVMAVLTTDAEVVRSKIETELLCLVAITRQLEIKEHHASANLELERGEKLKATRPTTVFEEHKKPQARQNELFNLIKGVGIIVLIFWAAIALFSKKHTGKPIEYTIISTTVNGRYYEKEATPNDLRSDFVTFEDGTRVSWADVQTKKMKVYPDELGIPTK